MKFIKKDGKVYNAVDAVHEHCENTDCLECKLYDRYSGCATWKYRNPEQTAILMGYEAIEDDTHDIREVVEENSEDAKRKLTRADILHAAEKCVCGQREQDYGTPEDNFETIAELWETYLRRACVDEAGGVYIDANDVAMMMALLKIARIAAGGGKTDSWIDLAGYAACGAECEGVTE
jgi:hypothetical protein